MHRLTDRIVDVSNIFQNTNVPIHERVCVSPPPYYIDWFERSYPNVPLNRDDGTFCLQCMNGIQGKIHLEDNGIDSLMQWSQFLSIRRAQFIMLSTSKFFWWKVSYLTVSNDDVLNTTNNENSFP